MTETVFYAVYDRDYPHAEGYSVKILALDWEQAIRRALVIGGRVDRVLDRIEVER